MDIRPRRSALYMPASNPRAIEKARALACDVVILDLEDAVAADAKQAARDAACAAVRDGGFGHREVVIRVNGLTTPWGEADLRAVGAARPDAMLVPKIDTADHIARASVLSVGVPVWAMVETPRALLDLAGLAAAPALVAMVLGTNDLAKDLRMTPGHDRLPFQSFLAQAVAAARAFDRVILDGVWNDIANGEGFASECDQGVRFGFDGKTLIHPSQIDACNRAFSPDGEEIAAARAIVAAFEAPDAAGRGVIKVDGRMVERLHLDQARRTLAVADRLGDAA